MEFSKELQAQVTKIVGEAVAAALKPVTQANADFAEQLGGLDKRITELSVPPASHGDAGDGKDGKDADFAELADRVGKLETELASAKKTADTATTELKRVRLMDFCEKLVGEGRMLPARKAATVEFMLSLDEEKKFDFAEAGGKTRKISQLDQYMNELSKAPKIGPDYRELSGGAGAPSVANAADFAELDEEGAKAVYAANRKAFKESGVSEKDFIGICERAGGAR